MQKYNKILATILSVALALSLVSCSQRNGEAASGNPAAVKTTDTVDFVDGLGRTVKILAPDKLKRVYSDSTNSLVLQYIIAPDTITASSTKFTEANLPYVPSNLINLPTYGTLSGANGVLDYEKMKAADVQLLISSAMGTSTTSDIEAADKLQEQLGIPIIVFPTQLDKLPQSFTLLGKALGREKEAAEVVAYLNGVVEKVNFVVAKIPENKRLTLYYAEGKDGLATEPGNSDRSIVFNMCGTKNVATVEALSGYGQASVSMEAVLSWNPEIIIVQSGTGAYDIIKKSKDWSSINAVKNGRVYEMPSKPFGWADRPPGANRYIGLLWLADLLYPDEMNIDFVDEVIKYYKVIYHVDITRADVEKLLINAIPQK